MEYDVLCSGQLHELIELVGEAIKGGWTPQGGVACSREHFCEVIHYYQAVVRETTDDK